MREEYNSVLSTPTEANIIDWPVLADTEKKLYFYDEYLILEDATASLKKFCHIA